MVQGAVAGLADHIEPVVLIRIFLEELDDVLVVSACHALICRQHDVGPLGVCDITLVEERMHRLFRQVGHHAGNGIAAYCFFEKKPAIDVKFVNDGQLAIF